ncbi:hypothetical protein [Endozoicomonas sp. ALC066]|uniref:hypothetical protein n=1 Tax=Endozoicomonas sp. ALC066 TaxID=3403078 RepID=UPI003BB65FA7
MKQSAASLLLAMAATLPVGGRLPGRRTRRKEGQKQLLAEYELIKQKKSKLSSNQRRRIVEYVETRLANKDSK